MKVLKIIHTMGHGGAENIFRWLARGLKENGIDVVAGIPMNNDSSNQENWITPALKELGIPCTFFDKTGNALSLFRNLKYMIEEHKPDIVHSHLLDSNFYSSLACKRLGIPHVCTEHGDIVLKRNIASRVKFYLLSGLSMSVVCVSEALRKKASTMCLFPSRLRLIYNGIIFPSRVDSSFRYEFGIPQSAIVIGNVGNLYPVKGQKYLVEAFAGFFYFNPNAYLVFVGRGEEEYNLRQQADHHGIPEERIIFTGFRRDVGNIMNAFDIYVQPSLSEGLPVAVLEALSLGLPMVATSVGGVSEIIGNSEHGLLVPPGSSEEIMRSLKGIMQAQEPFALRAKTGGNFVRDRFSVPQMTRKYIRLYQAVLS